jgi:hydroxypyruvate reductase
VGRKVPTVRIGATRPDGGLRGAAAEILESALAAADPYDATMRVLVREGDVVSVGGRPYRIAPGARVIAVGAGKACAPMARALEDALDDRLSGGLVVVRRGYGEPLRRVTIREAGHPVPDSAGEAAAQEALALVKGLTARDLVFFLISGGGSALLPLPHPGIPLADIVRTTDLLLRSGATITEVNTIRKHLSQVAGGNLARAAFPARSVTLIVSDVVGSPPDAVASGPTVADPTTYADALAVLERYGLVSEVPASVRDVLGKGARGALPETPKPDDPVFRDAQVLVVADTGAAARGALAAARRLGFHTLLLSTYLEGEARHVGRVLGGIGRQISATGEPAPRPACIVAGGETTVTVTGLGRGGRNQELALAAALALEAVPDVLVVGFATDGTDGPTDAAGAVADGTTVTRARALGMDPLRHLAANDAYPFFQALGDLIVTGPTNTNVADLMLILGGPPLQP